MSYYGPRYGINDAMLAGERLTAQVESAPESEVPVDTGGAVEEEVKAEQADKGAD